MCCSAAHMPYVPLYASWQALHRLCHPDPVYLYRSEYRETTIIRRSLSAPLHSGASIRRDS